MLSSLFDVTSCITLFISDKLTTQLFAFPRLICTNLERKREKKKVQKWESKMSREKFLLTTQSNKRKSRKNRVSLSFTDKNYVVDKMLFMCLDGMGKIAWFKWESFQFAYFPLNKLVFFKYYYLYLSHTSTLQCLLYILHLLFVCLTIIFQGYFAFRNVFF